ncbi:PREDICTED: glutamate receptor 2.8-like [Nelumbo nucifera]|uniref:Glutamate receptor n=2 Tax=Nelumbo nucifera TaxID=4432 RepID=A0A822YNJ0_NELNU|nr:PREDICTED: glutamate receptor 2.8-like [Nelumbo nucifera]DAD32565.1 TPA_asm: hypothetical protein HUJ06_011416 [Nelumbo nucifera]
MVSMRHLLLFGFFSLSLCFATGAHNRSFSANVSVHVGVVLDLNSQVGKMAQSCISMAVSDFYAKNSHYKTRMVLHTRDSKNDVITAASSVLDLKKDVEVQAIIGPQTSSQAKFVAYFGQRFQLPIVSFSATSPSISPEKTAYFIRTAQDDSVQVKAISAIIQACGWKAVVLIYEDTEYGSGIIPYFVDAFQEIDTKISYRSVISSCGNDSQILMELSKLMNMPTRVFIVHMRASLGSLFFTWAKEVGMINEGYAWIVTDGLSSLLDPIDSDAIDSMEGVLGVRPYVPISKELKDFKFRWKSKLNIENPSNQITELSLFGIWAYDTVQALAMAIERVGAMHPWYFKHYENLTELAKFDATVMGPKLLKMIQATGFRGLSGEFNLVNGQLRASVFEIFNVIGKGERLVGYWNPASGISRELNVTSKRMYSNSMDALRTIIWPGDSATIPRGWVIPTNGNKLRVGVPMTSGFTEFVKVDLDPSTNRTTVSGFSIDVFIAVMEALPFAVPYVFIPFMKTNGKSAGSYDELLYQIRLQEFDAVVGDVTIIANRSLYVDFTLPYTESGVAVVVPIKDDHRKNAWIFFKPLTWDLWLTIWLAFIFTGIVVWVLEHRINTEFRGPPGQQLGMIFWFSFSTLVFAHREKVVNNLSRFVLIVWVFVVFILMQSYTASLTSMLTVQQLQPKITDVKELIKNGYYVGYQKNSFVLGLLKRMNLDESKLRPYTSSEYDEALSKGSQNGGVAAIVDEIPYIKLFLAKYCSKYTIVGPTYKTDGFGFAFPVGSPLVSYVSRAILNLTEGNNMDMVEQKWFQTTCDDQSTTVSSNSLSLSSFWGLFLITGVSSASSLFIFLISFIYKHRNISSNIGSGNSFWRRLVTLAKYFDQKDLSQITGSMDQQKMEIRIVEDLSNFDGSQMPSSISIQTSQDSVLEGEVEGDLSA